MNEAVIWHQFCGNMNLYNAYYVPQLRTIIEGYWLHVLLQISNLVNVGIIYHVCKCWHNVLYIYLYSIVCIDYVLCFMSKMYYNCGLARRGGCNQSRNMIEIKYLPLQLVPGWVTTRVRSGNNLATYTRVANQPYRPFQPYHTNSTNFTGWWHQSSKPWSKKRKKYYIIYN